MFEYIKTLILGVVEGITEWLPVSSTGHMILVNEFIGKKDFTSDDLFLYVIQLGAILAVVTLYFKKLNPFSPSKTRDEKKGTWQMWFKVVVGCIPAGVIGLLFEDFMERFEKWQVVAPALIVYGVAFLVVENMKKKETVATIEEMSYKTALLIGLFQVLSIIPGTSRSGSTILGAMIVGTSRELAAEFCFFLAIPVMFGASFIKIITYEGALSGGDIALLITGMVCAYVVSLFAIKFLVSFVKKHDFKPFGWYRIALGAVVILYFAFIK